MRVSCPFAAPVADRAGPGWSLPILLVAMAGVAGLAAVAMVRAGRLRRHRTAEPALD